MTVRSKQVMTTVMFHVAEAVAGDPHLDVLAADIWTPPGDVTIIGGRLESGWNPYANWAFDNTGGIYVYAQVGIVARFNENGTLLSALQAEDPVETPTIGEHVSSGDRMKRDRFMLPEGYGIDLDQWHPLYLNMGYRLLAPANCEVVANAVIFFVLR